MKKLVAIGILGALAFFTWNSGRYERAFVAAAQDLKQRVPFEMAPGVRMDKADLKNKELVTQVTLTNEQPDISSVQKQMLANRIEKTMTTGWCHNDALRHAFDKEYSMVTVTLLADGSQLNRFSVGRVECICAEQKGNYCVH